MTNAQLKNRRWTRRAIKHQEKVVLVYYSLIATELKKGNYIHDSLTLSKQSD